MDQFRLWPLNEYKMDYTFLLFGMLLFIFIEYNPCSISCRSYNNQNFKMEVNVTDGLRCRPGRKNDICVQGRCVVSNILSFSGSKSPRNLHTQYIFSFFKILNVKVSVWLRSISWHESSTHFFIKLYY